MTEQRSDCVEIDLCAYHRACCRVSHHMWSYFPACQTGYFGRTTLDETIHSEPREWFSVPADEDCIIADASGYQLCQYAFGARQ